MNKFSKLFCGAALLGLMASCSSDEPKAPGLNGGSEGSFYTTLTLSMPNASRSATLDDPTDDTNSEDGFEVGLDPENNVGGVLVVLATKNKSGEYIYLTDAQADAVPQTGSEAGHENHKVYKVTFKNEELLKHPEEEVYVFAYCNPTDDLKENIDKLFDNDGDGKGIGTIENSEKAQIWTANRFLMTNRDLTVANLPSSAELATSTPDNPFGLGTVHVQRVACRFDFKQTTVKDQTEANVYPIKEIASGEIVANVRLTDLALVNLAKQYYYLPWINNGDAGVMAGAQLCGRELKGSWVVSPNADFKKKAGLKDETFDFSNAELSKYYFYSSGYQTEGEGFNPATATDLVWTSFEELVQDDNKDHSTWGPGMSDAEKTGYKIWRYATENTLPTVESQKHGFTTGVVFKGGLEAADKDSDLGKAMAAGHPVYLLDGTLYGDKAMVLDYITKHPASVVADNWDAAHVDGNYDENDDLLTPGNSGFTIYRYDEVSKMYPIYYFYWNRHNDNTLNTKMGRMEFATVRDNVYKLSVSEIKRYGKPTDNPGDDDESPETYFTVNVHVLPWVVRVNNIVL